jgi:hypothetical protein
MFIEWMYPGTQLALEACITRNKGSVVSENELKAVCVLKQQQSIQPNIGSVYLEFSNGFAGSQSLNLGPGGPLMEIHGQNASSEYIITEIDAELSVIDKNSSKISLSLVFGGLWILPHQDVAAPLGRSGLEEYGVPYQKVSELIQSGSHWSWSVSGVKGILIKVR